MPAVPKLINLPETQQPLDLHETTNGFNARLQSGELETYRPTRLGFPALDPCLGGGLQAEDLCLVGGMQNVGKTIVGLQAARNLATAGDVLPIVVCYEHGPEALLHRLMCMESVDDPDRPCPTGVSRAEIQTAVLAYYDAHPDPEARKALDLQWVLERLPHAERAWFRMAPYLRRLWLVAGDGTETTLESLVEYVKMARSLGFVRVLLIVDYAQRVPLRLRYGADLTEAERIDLVMRGLKGLAMSQHVPVVAVAAADAEGLRQQRVHVENLWGPATVQYEPDVALILNRDTVDGETGERTVRLAIEKNRNGPSEVEFRHRLHGAFYCISPHGERVPDAQSFQAERIGLRRQRADGPGLSPLLALLLLMERGGVGGDEAMRGLLVRAATAEDGGASLLPEMAERLGRAPLLEDGREGP